MNEKRLREIEARQVEIRTMLQGDGDVDLDAITRELDGLEIEKRQIERRREIADGLSTGPRADILAARVDMTSVPDAGIVEARAAEIPSNIRAIDRAGDRVATGASVADSVEYRNAWARSMLGMELAPPERGVFERVNAEYRAFAHTTENTGVLIPETVVAGIWKRAEEAYPLWGDVRKFAVSGTLTMKKFTGIQQGDAAWYDEPTPVADEENTFAEISLSGCELAKSVTVSWKLRAMAVSDFIPFLEREVGERMGVALGHAVYTGKGKPGGSETFKAEPRGIKTALLAQTDTPQVMEYSVAALKEADLRAMVAKLHSSYIAGATWYVNNTTAWTTLAGIQDANKRSILISDVAAQGAVGRVFGMLVKIDAAIGSGEILLANPQAGYWANTNRQMTMHTEDHVKARETDYMGYAIVDGDVYDEKAFVLLKPEAVTP